MKSWIVGEDNRLSVRVSLRGWSSIIRGQERIISRLITMKIWKNTSILMVFFSSYMVRKALFYFFENIARDQSISVNYQFLKNQNTIYKKREPI
jgi:hypothetical protein